MSDTPKERGFFEQMLEKLSAEKVPPGQWPQSVSSILAQRIDSALQADTRKPLESLNELLQRALSPALQSTSQPVVDAALGREKADPALRDAFMLGMLSFAQEITAAAAIRRADDKAVKAILALMRDPVLRELLEALDREQLSREELAERFTRPVETVKEQVRQLAQLGLVDFRSVRALPHFFTTLLGVQALTLSAS